jgi:sugar phosphate isomerase/epimerase
MQISSQPPAHLTYCLNVHPGEALADQIAAIRNHAVAVRAAVAPGVRFGLGLRLSNRAALELDEPAALRGLQALLAEQNMYGFTINGFPFGEFHGGAVKEKVYLPDWRTPERREYTCRLARHLSAILPENMAGSISTVPGSYKAWIRSPAEVEAMVQNLAQTAVVLAEIKKQSGREIHLGLEPKPDCFLETTAETVAFFEQQLWPRGARLAADAIGCSVSTAENLLRRHIGVCFDTCHLALQFEELGASLNLLTARGIRISKIQVSAALKTAWSSKTATALRPFCDPVYLHQVKTLTGGRVTSRGDLESALADPAAPEGAEWRVHCHVPLYFAGGGGLASTADQLTPAFFGQALKAGVEHFEIETYTFNVLPEPLRRQGIDRSLAEEYRWLFARLPARKC